MQNSILYLISMRILNNIEYVRDLLDKKLKVYEPSAF